MTMTECLKFASSTIGKTVIIAVAVSALMGWTYHRGEVRGLAQVTALNEQVTELKTDLAGTALLKQQAEMQRLKTSDLQARLQSSEAGSTQLKQKVDDYVHELAKRKIPSACVVTPADVRSLQRIR